MESMRYKSYKRLAEQMKTFFLEVFKVQNYRYTLPCRKTRKVEEDIQIRLTLTISIAAFRSSEDKPRRRYFGCRYLAIFKSTSSISFENLQSIGQSPEMKFLSVSNEVCSRKKKNFTLPYCKLELRKRYTVLIA
jgi:hypothetical protein